jgi:hypothetical protein
VATAGDQINRALRLLGVLAEGETPSASESADALVALNQMIDSWNTERLSVYSTQDQSFTWTAGNRTRTLGPTGDFVGTRPVLLDTSTYFIYNNLSYVPDIINQQQYDSIALKTATSTFPQVLFVNMTHPDIEMTVYPVPTSDTVWHFISVEELTQPATLATTLSFPPGYLRAFAYNLAMEIAPEFGIEPPAMVKRIATTSKRNLKRINNPGDLLSMPGAIITNPRYWGNVYNGWMS